MQLNKNSLLKFFVCVTDIENRIRVLLKVIYYSDISHTHKSGTLIQLPFYTQQLKYIECVDEIEVFSAQSVKAIFVTFTYNMLTLCKSITEHKLVTQFDAQ